MFWTRKWVILKEYSFIQLGFPGSSAGKESTCNAGEADSIPGLKRSSGEGIGYPLQYSWASLVAQIVKNPPTMQETWVQSLMGRSPGGGHGNPLQYFCLETPMDRGAWQAAAHGVAKSWTQLNDIHACTHSTALTKAASVRQPPAPEREDKQLKSNPPCCKALPATSTITHNKSKVPLACKALPTMSKITHNKSKVQ